MKINVPIKNEKAQDFLEYLMSKIESVGNWTGHGTYNSNGQFIETIELKLSHLNDTDGKIVITCVWNKDGTFKPILTFKAIGALPKEWENIIRDVVEQSLVAVINEETKTFFFRYTFAYFGPPLDGEYYIERFRIAPTIPYEQNIILIDEKVMYLDMEVKAIDHTQAIALGKIKSEKIISLLSLFLNVGFYSIPTERRWVLINGKRNDIFQLGFIKTNPDPNKIPKKGSECSPGLLLKVDRSNFDYIEHQKTLKCPSDIRKLFCCYYRLSSREQKAFLGASTLYKISLVAGRHFPSVKMSYQIAAIDSLIVGENHTLDSFVKLLVA